MQCNELIFTLIFTSVIRSGMLDIRFGLWSFLQLFIMHLITLHNNLEIMWMWVSRIQRRLNYFLLHVQEQHCFGIKKTWNVAHELYDGIFMELQFFKYIYLYSTEEIMRNNNSLNHHYNAKPFPCLLKGSCLTVSYKYGLNIKLMMKQYYIRN